MPKNAVKFKKQVNKKSSLLTRGKIIAYHEDGKSVRAVSKIVNVPRSTVQDIIAIHRETGHIFRRKGSDRPRKTTKRQDNVITRIAKQNPFTPSREISKNVCLEHNINVSYTTVQRRLHEVGLDGCVSRKKPFISDANIEKRLEFAIKHKSWTADDWKRVLWCDESPFTLSYHGRQYIWRPKGKAYDPKYIKPTFKHGGGNIQVWGCFSWYGVGDLYKINGTLVSFFVYFIPKFMRFYFFFLISVARQFL